MPTKTPHFDLTTFSEGDNYLVSGDRSRMTIIDNQFTIQADLIGDGVISGWTVTATSGLGIKVSKGVGIIERVVTSTFGDLNITLGNHPRNYVFMKRKPDIMADLSAFSTINATEYLDSTAPSQPTNLSVDDTDYNLITISWDANTEGDLDYYEIYRKLQADVSYTLIASQEAVTYTDTDVEQDETYNYKVFAVDVNGLSSIASSVLVASTDMDTRNPDDPTNLFVVNGDETLQILWDAAGFLVNTYELTLQPIDSQGAPDGAAVVYSYPKTTLSVILTGLDNGQFYEVTLKSVSVNGYKSSGVSVRGQPVYSFGVPQFETFNIDETIIDDSYNLMLSLTWTLQANPYFPDPAYYLITVNASESDPQPSYYSGSPASIVNYTVGTDQIVTIKENTLYEIKVQSVTTEGLISQAYVIRHRTDKYSPPLPVTNLSVSGNYSSTSKYVTVSWNNSRSDFAYNTITIVKTPLATDLDPSPTPVTLINNKNIGNAETYDLAKSLINNQALYSIAIKVFDAQGNISDTETDTVLLNTELSDTAIQGGADITGSRPEVPEQLNSISGNDQVTIYWSKVESDFIDGYTVWRAELPGRALVYTDWEAVATVPSTQFKFVDYAVDNGSKYFYFVTSIDIFGKRSPNPEDDGYFAYVLAVGEPRGHSALTKPPSITVIEDPSNTHNWLISWDADEDSFDGFQIYRSYNGGVYEQIGSVDAFSTSYTDVGGRWKSGIYKYMIRKFRNEGEVIVSTSNVTPIGAIPIATVTVSSGSVATITESARNIELMRDPIRDEVKTQLNAHTHLWYGNGDDRRIRLAENLQIDDWTADSNYQVYTTEFDINGGTSHYVYLDNVLSPYNSVLDATDGTLTFETPIYDPNSGGTAPAISVIILGTGEVEGVLTANQFGTIIASKVTKGKLSFDVLSEVDHFGRLKEPCVPKRYGLTRTTGFVYSGTTPSGVTFYDVIKTSDNRLLAATSDGLQITLTDDGSRWEVALSTDLPCTRVFRSSVNTLWHFAIAGNKVFYTNDLVLWTEILGTDGVSIVRDITEDELGIIFISTNTGVYKIDPLQYTKLYWTQVTLLDELDSNAYGIFYDTTASKLLVSGNRGIYESSNSGTSWSLVSNLQVSSPVFTIVRVGSYHFMLSENKLFRRLASNNSFNVVSTLSTVCRKIVYFEGELYITSDSGLLKTDTDASIFTDSNIKFVPAFKHLSRNHIVPVTFGLRLIDGRMWLGMDERIYSVSSRKETFLNGEIVGIVPTIFVNDIERSVGVFYGTNNKVLFDTKQLPTDMVEIVKDYTEYTLLNGGWADTKYDAEITLVINGNEQPSASAVSFSNKASDVSTVVQSIVLPFFSPRNSNFNDAFKYYKQSIVLADAIATDGLLTPDKVITPDRMNDLFTSINLMKNNLDEDVQAQVIFPKMSGTVATNSGITYDYDVVTGNLVIYNGANKYTRVAMTIEGVGLINNGTYSHREIDDTLEQINSGLPSSLASVQQSNIIKMGLFSQRIEPDVLSGRNKIYQARYSNPCDSNWYDSLNSTVDYSQELNQEPTEQIIDGNTVFGSFSIEYPADVLYIPDRGEVWVCGAGGIMAVDTTTYECSKIVQSEFYFFNMHLDNGTVYTIAEDGVYTINTTTLKVTLNVDLDPPSGFTSILHFGDTDFIATSDGLYAKQTYEPSWRNVLSVTNSFVRSTESLTFCIGVDPTDTTGNTYVVFYSHSGAVWNRSNQFVDYIISGAAKRYDAIYYATNSGLLVEDLGRLFGGGEQTLEAIDLNGDDEADDFPINAVDADTDIVIAARDNGVFYVLSGGTWTEYTSSLQTIHKVKAIEGTYWLFANSQIEIEGANRIVELTTGKALI